MCVRQFPPMLSDDCWSPVAAGCRDPRQGPSLSLALKPQMTHHDFNSLILAQAFRHLLRHEYRSMLSTRTAERHHQILKTAALVVAHTCSHQRCRIRQKPMDAL